MLESLLRWFSPFRLMKDTGMGTREERIAAYRYNRLRRGELGACMRRWVLVLSAAALLTQGFDVLGGQGAHLQGPPNVFVFLAAACATFLVCGLCVLFVTAYVYVYLTSHEG
ncbi:MAG: hypothetical protein HIU85_11555 [Proteobacteria bacterium]|nr:hypothetical protein [Pseudomonadota bacterium]